METKKKNNNINDDKTIFFSFFDLKLFFPCPINSIPRSQFRRYSSSRKTNMADASDIMRIMNPTYACLELFRYTPR